MARRKIIWSHRAKIRRYEILDFYINRNNSSTFSKKLNLQFNKAVKMLSKYPDLGLKTDLEGVRGLIIDQFVMFYEADSKSIIIHHIWDSRQNPKDLKIK